MIKKSPGSLPIKGSLSVEEIRIPASTKTIPIVIKILPASVILFFSEILDSCLTNNYILPKKYDHIKFMPFY
ncbi:MAG: hypothetical protein NZM26_03270 [Patescibacteria group bacterium]|nr:hypothetical protein [Patescibacteria group bacterium]